MAQINFRGLVLQAPGPWGAARPAPDVALAISDEDIGNASDTLWSGTSNAQGQYAGTTREWRDMRNVTVATPTGTRTTQVADVADVMMLKATAIQRVGQRAHSATVPFVPAPAGLPQPPIVLGWGPPGRARVTVDGVVTTTLSQFARLVADAFTIGSATAGLVVRHEILVIGEELALLRNAIATIEPELRRIEAQILPLVQRARTERKPGEQQAQARRQNNFSTATAQVGATGRAVVSGLPAGPDPWAPIRQQLAALARLLDQEVQRQAAVWDHANGSRVAAFASEVGRSLCAALPGALQASLGAAPLLAVVAAAIVACVTTVVANLPALVGALGALVEIDLGAAALGEFMDQSWVASVLAVVCVVCAAVMLVATSPAEGWTWFIEQVTGDNGLPGLRFVLAR